MTPIRFAIWAAVSTKEQAADEKASLRVQETECRRVGLEKSWLETSGPYIVRGASRTRWVNLHDAEKAVPELRQMLDAAQSRAFDVLIVKDYDRFRDLLDQVYRTLNDYNVQLYSLAQPLEPVSPEKFDPYDSDSQELLIGFSQMRSRAEIRTTRRRYRTGMPDRIRQHGLPLHIPYGYRKPPGREADRQAVPVQDDTLTPHLLAIKDGFLAGLSTRQLAESLQAAGVPTPHGAPSWNQVTVRQLLRNPFYAGFVRFGVSKIHHDRRTGRRTREMLDANLAITATGKHLPLWDETTHQAILAEFDRRAQRYSGRRANTLSGLLVCGQCGKPMWLNYTGRGKQSHDPATIVWRCGSRQPGHPAIKNTVALRQITNELRHALSGEWTGSAPIDPNPQLDQQILDLYQRRKRIQDAYDDGLYTLAETRAKLEPLEKHLALLERTTRQQILDERAASERAKLIALLLGRLDQLENIILGDRLQDVNHVLKSLLQAVVIIDSETTNILFR